MSSKDFCERCPRLPGVFQASSRKTFGFLTVCDPETFALWWRRNVLIHLDNHAFKVALRVQGRRLIARRRVRGVYRKKGTGFNAAHVKPGRKLRLPTVAKNVFIGGGAGGGKMLVWHHIENNSGGVEAVKFYKEAVRPALRKQYPGKRKFVILEDNDPTGN